MAKANPTHFAGGPGVPLHPENVPPYVPRRRAALDVDLAHPSYSEPAPVRRSMRESKAEKGRRALNATGRTELDKLVLAILAYRRNPDSPAAGSPVKLAVIRGTVLAKGTNAAPSTMNAGGIDWYDECGKSLQRLKAEGKVRLITGARGGWVSP